MEKEPMSIFIKAEGDRPLNRIWDFLITYSEYDYSLKEISKLSEVSYAMTKIIFKDYFIPRKFVKQRSVGQAKLFHLDFDNLVVEKFREYYIAVVEANTDITAEKKLNEENKENITECIA
jgi:hypothetical protein